MKTSRGHFTEDWENVGRTAKPFNTPTNSKDRSSDDQPFVDLAAFGYCPFSAEPRLLFASPTEVRGDGDWQCSQSEKSEGWVEVVMEGSDEELDNSTRNCEGGQVKPKSELYARQK